MKCETCGKTYPSEYYFHDEGREAPLICTGCFAALPEEQRAARSRAEAAQAGGPVPDPLLTRTPKLGFLGWAFSGGVISGAIPGSGRGTFGVAVLVVGALSTLPAATNASDASVQTRLVGLTLVFLVIALFLIASGYSAYSEAYQKELESGRTKKAADRGAEAGVGAPVGTQSSPSDGPAAAAAASAPLASDQKEALEKLMGDLGNEYDIEGRIRAAEQMGALTQFGDVDAVAALAAAGRNGAMKFEVKRMTIASMRGVRPEQIEVMAHADDSRVTTAAVKALRSLASHKDQVGVASKAAIDDLKASIKSAEIRKRVGL